MSDSENNFFLQQFALEKLAKHLAINSTEILHVTIDNAKSPYDLQYKDQRYQVKISKPVITDKAKKSEMWDFDMRSDAWKDGRNVKVERTRQCDFYILIGLKNGIAAKTFLLPYAESPRSHTRISVEGSSKYHKYEI